jgi:2-dehydro-3-deoxygluconokinase
VTHLDLVTIGEPLVVMIPEKPGPLRAVARFDRGMGGAECNAVLGLSRLGARCGLISRVGGDEFGAYVLETLRASGIDTSHVTIDAVGRTGMYFKERLPFHGQANPIYYREGSAAASLSPSQVDAAYVGRARAFLATGVTALLSPSAYEAVTYGLETARSAGVLTLFDPNLRRGLWGSERAKDLLPSLMRLAEVWLGGEWEARYLLDADETVSCRELTEKLAAAGSAEVVLKRGPLGAVALGPDGCYYEHLAVQTAVVSVVGAGDAFNAGYLFARQRGDDVAQALRIASICGAAVCAGLGDSETFPRLHDLEALEAELRA